MTDETKKILVKALEQLVVYAKNDKTLSWNWDRKTEGQYRLEIIVDTSNPLEHLVKPTLAEEEKDYLRGTLNLEIADAKIALTRMYKGKSHQLLSKRIKIIESIISKCSL